MKRLLHYLGISFVFDLKRHMAYPNAFIIAFFVLPFWSLVQLLFLEVIFGQTNMFLGYSKYEAYVLFGTYRLASNFGYFIFVGRIYELKSLIRGTGHETFDSILTKPIDSQLYVSLGRYGFGDISQLLVGVALLFYGLYKEPHTFTIFNIIAYILLVLCGIVLLYCLYLSFRSLIFWFQEFEVSEGFYETYRNFGKYPSQLYTGVLGLIFNLLIPITLTAGIPVDFLFGKVPWYMLFVYIGIITLLFIATRFFWLTSIKKYSSFSS